MKAEILIIIKDDGHLKGLGHSILWDNIFYRIKEQSSFITRACLYLGRFEHRKSFWRSEATFEVDYTLLKSFCI